jgi:large subunit ribosomal protein L21
MYAVIKTGGKQYRVAEDQVIKVEKIKGEPGQIVQLSEVLMLGGDTPQIGTPTVAGASVAAEVLEQTRGPKIIAFKKRRRKNSRRKRGHRQAFTLLRITEILTEGRTPSKPPQGRVQRRPKTEAVTEAVTEAAKDATEQTA